MDTAYVGLDDCLWDASKLNKRAEKENDPDAWLAIRRPTIICMDCEVRTTFRRKATNGRKANYAATHDPGCDYFTQSTSNKENGGLAVPVPAKFNDGGNKKIRYDLPQPFNNGNPEEQSGMAVEIGTKGKPGKSYSLPSETAAAAHETVGLGRILSNLRNRDDYPLPTTEFNGVLASEYLVRIGTLTADTKTSGLTRAYWGEISSVDVSDNKGVETLWIRCDKIGSTFSIRLGQAAKDALFDAMKLSSYYDLDRSHVIVEGVMLKGLSKLFVTVTDIHKIAFRPRRPH